MRRTATFNEGDLRTFAGALLDPATGCAELRSFHATYGRGNFIEPAEQYSRTLAGWFDDPDALVVAAQRFRGISGFLTVNPVDRALLARCHNKLAKQKHTTADNDVVCLRWLYVDIDPERPADISSTDEELGRALGRRDAILADHPDLAACSLWGCSGNGAWILARLPDYPNGPDGRDLVARALAVLAAKYTGGGVKVDTSAKNPGRVMCLPGTMKCKGSDRPDRPWRLATIDAESGWLAKPKARAKAKAKV